MRTFALVLFLAAAAVADEAISTLSVQSSAAASATSSFAFADAAAVKSDTVEVLPSSEAGIVNVDTPAEVKDGIISATKSDLPVDVKDGVISSAVKGDSIDVKDGLTSELKSDISSPINVPSDVVSSVAKNDETVAAVGSSAEAASSVEAAPEIEVPAPEAKKIPVIVLAMLIPYPVSRPTPAFRQIPQLIYPTSSFIPYIPVAQASDVEVPLVSSLSRFACVNPRQVSTLNPYSQGVVPASYYQRAVVPVVPASARHYVVPQDYPYPINSLIE